MLWNLILALALAAAPGCAIAQQKLRVVTTSADLKSLAETVGGARVDVESITAPDQDPHVVELKPAQLARARGAALLIRIGLDHEPWHSKLRLPQSVVVLDTSLAVRLTQTQTPRLRVERRAHVHAYGNTHYWLDPDNAVAMTGAIRDALAKLSPQDAQFFEANRSAFVDALATKTQEWKRALAPFRGTKLVVVHDSWSYLADYFGLQVVAAAEPHPGVSPSPAELAALFTRMRETGVGILVADSHSNPALVRQIAAQSGARAVTLSSSGHDYIRLLDENVARLAAVLKRDRP
ncbi:MAG TPA: metal ABC transporter substrate-binding protein [Casimicrobiaceae bacterium]|nr:metal ABC transporter substrate-binding protein [Casimicrobiaceae bacterium]